MALRNCLRCGRLMTGSEPICPACQQAELDTFEAVRTYLREHPRARVSEVSAATGASVARIRRWVQEGRLKMTLDQLEGALQCRRCGAPIEGGALCPRCAAELAHSIGSGPGAPASDRSPQAPEGREKPGPGPESLRPEVGEEPGGAKSPRVHTIDRIRRRLQG